MTIKADSTQRRASDRPGRTNRQWCFINELQTAERSFTYSASPCVCGAGRNRGGDGKLRRWRVTPHKPSVPVCEMVVKRGSSLPRRMQCRPASQWLLNVQSIPTISALQTPRCGNLQIPPQTRDPPPESIDSRSRRASVHETCEPRRACLREMWLGKCRESQPLPALSEVALLNAEGMTCDSHGRKSMVKEQQTAKSPEGTTAVSPD